MLIKPYDCRISTQLGHDHLDIRDEVRALALREKAVTLFGFSAPPESRYIA